MHFRDLHIHQAGMAIRAIAFIGDPEGAQVTFLKDMDCQTLGARDFDGLRMYVTRVAIENNIGDRFFSEQLGKKGGPIGAFAAKWDQAGLVFPKKHIACIKTNAPSFGPGILQHGCKTLEKGPMWPLKE